MPTMGIYEENIVLLNFQTGSARLHLIIQFPVLNTSAQDTNYLVKRQQEYIYCLQRNLHSPHVSSFACVLKAKWVGMSVSL